MPSIRIRYNFNTVTLNERGVQDGHKSLCGSTVEVIRSNGTTERYDFKGFRNYDDYRNTLIPTQFCKVWNVQVFYADDYGKADFLDASDYCIGVYEAHENSVYLLLEDGKLMSRHATKIPQNSVKRTHDNVVSLKGSQSH